MKRELGLVALSMALLCFSACSSAKRTGATVQDATVAAGQEVGDKAEDAAEATAEAGRDLARATDDPTITSAVKMKFARDKTVEAFDIDVDTENGNVTLNGTVNTKAEADRAIELARSVEGVKNVKSNLKIQNP